MTAVFVFAAIHVLVPVALLVWQWRARVSSGVQWLARTAAFAAFFLALHFGGFWIVLPHWLSFVYLGAFACVSAGSFLRVRGLPRWSAANIRHAADVAVNAVFAVLFAAGAAVALLGHRAPAGEAAALAFPLQGGSYMIGSGGANGLMNFHLKALDDPALRQWRGQSYALDIVKLNAAGARASGFAPADLEAYAIFGEAIHAPCDGAVLGSRDDLPDYTPPGRDPVNLAGNFVFLQCAGFRVLLAHMKSGSVRVREAETVTTGQLLGRVGNSGNTTEPHLHLHAQRAGSAGQIFDGEPLPLTVDGRFLARNDRVHSD